MLYDSQNSKSARPGSIAGPLVLRDMRGLHDLRKVIWTGPTQSSDIIHVEEQNVRLMLLVEKHTIFERLRVDGFPERNNCLLATGGGFPGRAFRAALHTIHAQLRVPLYVLADNDPAGYELFFLLSRGAGFAEKESTEHAIPSAVFLGLRAEHVERYGLDDRVRIKLTSDERIALKRLQKRSWLAHENEWQNETDALLNRGSKVEVEAFCFLSLPFLAETYLPERLNAGDHLRLMRS